MMRGCPSRRRLFEHLDGRLSGVDAKILGLHLETCDRCGSAFERAARVRGALRDLGDKAPAPPAENLQTEGRLMQAVAERGTPRGAVQWWWLPATAAAALLVGFLVFPRLRGADDPDVSGAPVAGAVAEGPGARAGGPVATVVGTRGGAVAGPSAGALEKARAGDVLGPGFVVRCPADCETKIDLASGGVLVLHADTEVVLPSATDGLVLMAAGVLRVSVVPRPEGKRPFGVETPVARVEAIGTEFEVTHRSEEGTSVEVFEGRVRFVSLASDEDILVAAGARARVDRAGVVSSAGAAAAVAGEPVQQVEPPAIAAVPQEQGRIEHAQPRQIRRVRGTIDGGAVRARVSRQRGAFQACYTDYALRLNPRSVEAAVRFVVLEDGAIGEFNANLSVPDRQLAECIERVFRSIRFPRPSGGPAQVHYPLRLSL